MDACIDHAVASNDEHKAVVILADEFGRQGIDGLRVFICGDRFACTDGSNERHRDHLLAAPGIGHDFDRARRVRILTDRALKFQTLQIIVHGGCRAQTDRLSDLADSRGEAAVPDLLTDKFKDRFFACGQFIRIVFFSHGKVLSLISCSQLVSIIPYSRGNRNICLSESLFVKNTAFFYNKTNERLLLFPLVIHFRIHYNNENMTSPISMKEDTNELSGNI